jgi:hypothetical protein
MVLVAEGDRLYRSGRVGILRGSAREAGLARRPRIPRSRRLDGGACSL